MAQLSSLAVTLAVRIVSSEAFACDPLYTAHQETQRDYFLLIVVIPYFVCFVLSFLCALYVVKALLAQTKREQKVRHSATPPGGLKYPSLLQVLPFTIEESFTHQIELSDIKNEVDYLGFHHHRTTRTMSCPTKLKAEEESNLFKRAASNFAVTGLKLSELRRDFLPTIKTLAMLFLYLLMSSPFYISATVHRHCSPVQVSNHKLTLSLIIFFS